MDGGMAIDRVGLKDSVAPSVTSNNDARTTAINALDVAFASPEVTLRDSRLLTQASYSLSRPHAIRVIIQPRATLAIIWPQATQAIVQTTQIADRECASSMLTDQIHFILL